MIEIDGLKIGRGQPCRITAECCQNHMGDFALALEMVIQAKRCGADIVKFQHHDKNDIRRMKRALSIQEHKSLKHLCEDIGIVYLCTPFSIEAAKELNDIGVKAFKIASGQSSNQEFLIAVRKFKKPIIISEPFRSIKFEFFSLGKDRHYFMNPSNYNGFSCHSPTIYPAIAAIGLGAKLIEKHFILDKRQVCADQYVSIDGNQLDELVKAKKIIEGLL